LRARARSSPLGRFRLASCPSTRPRGALGKPANLSAGVSRDWDRLTGELDRSHFRLSEAHRATLTLAATVAADIAAMWKVIEVEGLFWTNKKTGEPKEHPAAKRMDALRRDYLKALTMLGLRASVAEPEERQEETLEDILRG
jgi:phage terminase small subunit